MLHYARMRVTQHVLILICFTSVGQCPMQPYIIDGHNASINDFPYNAFLSIKCVKEDEATTSYVCGSSIVNQHLTLTAAHCTDVCTGKSSVTVYVGHKIRFLGAYSTAHSFLQHEYYHARKLRNDICLVRLNIPLQFSAMVNRVALMENPPYDEEAVVAGWGMYNVKSKEYSNILQYAKQYVKSVEYCRNHTGQAGTICATHKDGYVARGDSGNALVVRNYVQIGIVSFTRNMYTTEDRLVFYTDTGYYYKWIEENSKTIMCI